MKRTALQRKTPLSRNPENTGFLDRGRASSGRTMGKRTGKGMAASRAQQAKTRLMGLCVGCGGLATDSMHLWPRSLGGCQDPDCTLPGCRTCHSLFDRGELDLSGVLALPEFVAERVHMASHASFDRCMRRLSGRRWVPGERDQILAVVNEEESSGTA